jgi:Zn-dependent peptidase ImmA (M78 family)
VTSLAKSALATKTERGWVIVLRADEPLVRQRFSLAHEIKHLLDDELTTARRRLYVPSATHSTEEQTERVCDHFAACLLMPKMLLRRDWTSGIQEPLRLARRYQVSKTALEIRLRELGLSEPVPRCGTSAAHAPSD